MTVHDFNASLDVSNSGKYNELFDACYRAWFPNLEVITRHLLYGYWQTGGIDTSVILTTSQQILIDEKIRLKGPGGRIYNDILLEHVSNDRKNTPGWVCKPLLADFIAYLNVPLGTCYKLPVNDLQNAWEINKNEWISRYGIKPAQNKGYRSLSTPVPVNILLDAIKDLTVLKTKDNNMEYDNTNRGSIWKNDRKETDNHPDFKGSLNVDGKEFWVSAWRRKPDANPNAPALSFSVQPKEQQQQVQQSAPAQAEQDIPF